MKPFVSHNFEKEEISITTTMKPMSLLFRKPKKEKMKRRAKLQWNYHILKGQVKNFHN